ncbi:ATP-binding protein [Acetobacterium paludosum]|uniref:ATP-binding protein n=1 Tax=Acetobacterium paludosum TaxID=52693 RepID=A0A923HY76_9FIRM|nr:ATP-binding protein [Acetobacterium paludosum]MBC3888804.1 ATP-binding protein [Acetobacterium paludosum]
MTISVLPVDQRVIDIDSRRFASIEKALVELITNCDDSYARLESRGIMVTGKITIAYERHQNGAFISVSDQAEGMTSDRLHSVLAYGGAYSNLAQGEASGRGYFGRGMKQAIYGLGHGWIETIKESRESRIDLYRAATGEYLFDDGEGAKTLTDRDYVRLDVPLNGSGTRVSIVIENQQVNIPHFQSLVSSITNNIYLRDILSRRHVGMVDLNKPPKSRIMATLNYQEPKSEVLIGPGELGSFSYQDQNYTFSLTLKKAKDAELILKGDQRTNGLLVISGTAVFDCQFFNFENQLGTEFLFGSVICDDLTKMLGQGHPIISDERDGLNRKEPFVAAFSDAVSKMIINIVKSEQLRLSHVDRARTSQRTNLLIDTVLEKMNRIAVEELGIRLPRNPGMNIVRSKNPEALRFSTAFYYRKVKHPFHITLTIDRNQLAEQELLSFINELPAAFTINPSPVAMPVAAIPDNGKLVFTIIGNEIGARGTFGVTSYNYEAFCEVVISDSASGTDQEYLPKKPPASLDRDDSRSLFRGYELRNLGNDTERAIYSSEERLILINIEAPTVRLYVDGRGRFTDGARLLLAELLLDVIAAEMAHRYIDRTSQKGQETAYHQAKQDMVRRYGVEIHSILLGK